MTASPNPPMPPVDRTKGTTKGSGGAGGGGGMITAGLAVLCVILAIACIVLFSGKQTLTDKVGKLEQQVADAKDAADKQRGLLDQQANDIKVLRNQIMQSVRIVDLPAPVQGANPGETRQKVQALVDAGTPRPIVPGPGGTSGTALPPTTNADAASAWLERIAQQITKQSIDTKTAPGTDAAKAEMYKGIQIVLSKIGAYSKPLSGAQKDTMDAVLAFQKANGLKADGVVGKGTWGKVREKFEQAVARR